MITQNGESSRDLLLSVSNRKALAPGGHSPQTPPPPPRPPLKTLITLLPVTSLSHNSTRIWGCWLGKKVSTLIGYLLTHGLNC